MTFFFVTYPQREVVIPNAAQPWVRQGNSTATWVLNQLSFDAPNPGNPAQDRLRLSFALSRWIDGADAVAGGKNSDH